MSYQSIQFVLFFAVVLVFYYVLPRKFQGYILLIANLTFYCIAGLKYLPFLLITLITSYASALAIGNIYKSSDALLENAKDSTEKKAIRADAKRRAKSVLIIALIIALGLLIVCKYSKFILRNIAAITGDSSALDGFLGLNLILPLGISFYTFMAVGYVLDVFWKRYPAEINLIRYTAFLTYFPHIAQGPIDRYNEFLPQFKGGVAFDAKKHTHMGSSSCSGDSLRNSL